jgi:hypothetical protein
VNPYRYTHFTNIDAWTKALTPRAASEYLGMLRASIDSPHVALDLRLPGFFEYTEALEIELERTLKREISARLALDRVAVKWEQITERGGRKKQKAIYRASMELPPKPSAKKEKYVIGFSQATTTEPWRLLFNKVLRQEAAKYSNIELIVADGLDDIDKQVRDVADFMRQKVDAILITEPASR